MRLVTVIARSSIRDSLQAVCFLITISILCYGQLVAQGKTVEEQNKKLIHIATEEIANKGNLDKISELFTSDFVQHFLTDNSQIKGVADLKSQMAQVHKAFPDWTEVIDLVVAEGDYVFLQFSSTGTNTGSFLGNPPTDKIINISEVTIFRFDDGKIAEQWLLPDVLSLNQQLGIIQSDN